MTAFATPATTLDDLGWSRIQGALSARARTARGRDRALVLSFLDSRELVEASLERIEEARALKRSEAVIPLGGIRDVSAALGRAEREAVLAPEEILACAEVIRAAAAVRTFLGGRRAEQQRLAKIADGLKDLSGLAARVDEAFEPSGRIKDTASDALATYRSRARQLHRDIKARVEGILGDSDKQALLQDNYFSIRNDRYVLPIKASHRSQMPGIVHNASNSGQTLFIEPQYLVDLGNELSIAESLAVEEEQQILVEFSGYIGDRAKDLEDAVERLAVLDLAQAAAELADTLDASVPDLRDRSAAFLLRGVRHPLLVLQGKAVVPNDVGFRESERALVLSGPNAGGKTVTITMVGLCSLMVRAGLPIPASPGTTLPFFDGVYTAIGDAQDLARDLSTFSAHLTRLRDILEQTATGWLVVIDEIAADTDPKEGAAIATATLEEMVRRGARVLVTTHLDEVKAMGLTDERFANARVGFDPESQRPTYRLELGAAGTSNAIDVARQVGLPESILARAADQLREGGALSIALEALSNEQRRAEEERQALARASEQVNAQRAELDELRRQASSARRDAELRVREEMADQIAASREKVTRMIAELQAHPKMARAQRAQKELDARAEEIEAEAARLRTNRNTPRASGSAPPVDVGAQVVVPSLGKRGEVLAIEGDGAIVALGMLRTRVPVADLIVVAATKPRPKPSSAKPSRRRGKTMAEDVAARPLEHPEARCDLRGLRADEAMREIERFLDRASYAGPPVVLLIHGHGTGALKTMVRESLQELPCVAHFRPGEAHEGGDGVTVVELRD